MFVGGSSDDDVKGIPADCNKTDKTYTPRPTPADDIQWQSTGQPPELMKPKTLPNSPTKPLLTKITPDLHRRLKLHASNTGISMSKLVRNTLEMTLPKYQV